ncbi:MAG: DUF2953 domain-containing protein [Pseudomonadota bacterium]
MLAILLGLLIFLLLLLLLPFDVVFRLNSDGVPGVRVGITWGYGLVRKDFIKTEQKPVSKSEVTRQLQRESRKGIGKFQRKGTKSAWIFVRSPGMPGRLVRFARDMLRQIRVREMKLHLDLGLDDPADTGRLYGILSPMLILLQQVPRVDMRLQPDFTQAVFMVTGRGHIRVIPLAVLRVMLGFLLSPTCWRAFYATIKGAGT